MAAAAADLVIMMMFMMMSMMMIMSIIIHHHKRYHHQHHLSHMTAGTKLPFAQLHELAEPPPVDAFLLGRGMGARRGQAGMMGRSSSSSSSVHRRASSADPRDSSECPR